MIHRITHDGTNWYFYDITGMKAHGPHKTPREARNAMREHDSRETPVLAKLLHA